MAQQHTYSVEVLRALVSITTDPSFTEPTDCVSLITRLTDPECTAAKALDFIEKGGSKTLAQLRDAMLICSLMMHHYGKDKRLLPFVSSGPYRFFSSTRAGQWFQSAANVADRDDDPEGYKFNVLFYIESPNKEPQPRRHALVTFLVSNQECSSVPSASDVTHISIHSITTFSTCGEMGNVGSSIKTRVTALCLRLFPGMRLRHGSSGSSTAHNAAATDTIPPPVLKFINNTCVQMYDEGLGLSFKPPEQGCPSLAWGSIVATLWHLADYQPELATHDLDRSLTVHAVMEFFKSIIEETDTSPETLIKDFCNATIHAAKDYRAELDTPDKEVEHAHEFYEIQPEDRLLFENIEEKQQQSQKAMHEAREGEQREDDALDEQ